MYIHISWLYWVGVFIAAAGVTSWLAANLGRKVALPVALVLAGIAALDVVVASRGAFYFSPLSRIPYLPFGVALPLLAGAIGFAAFPSLREALQRIPHERLAGIHALRILGIMFVAMYLQGLLPAAFALTAGIGDILVGISAIGISARLRRGDPTVKSSVLVWNLAGILDLVVALTLGFLSASTPLRMIFENPPSDAVALLPTVLIPVFAVPIFLMLHAASLSRLLSREVSEHPAIHAA